MEKLKFKARISKHMVMVAKDMNMSPVSFTCCMPIASPAGSPGRPKRKASVLHTDRIVSIPLSFLQKTHCHWKDSFTRQNSFAIYTSAERTK